MSSSPAANTRSHSRISKPLPALPKTKAANPLSNKRISRPFPPLPIPPVPILPPRHAPKSKVQVKAAPPLLKIKNSNFRDTVPLKKSPAQAISGPSEPRKRMNTPTHLARNSSSRSRSKSPTRIPINNGAESQRKVSPTGSIQTLSSFFSMNSSRQTTHGPVSGVIAAGIDYHSRHSVSSAPPSIISTKTIHFLDKIVQADQKRYKDIDPELEPLRFPVSYIYAGILTIVFIAMLIFGDGKGNVGFTSVKDNPLIGPNIGTMVRFGGNVAPRVQESFDGEGWTIRLLFLF
jgi:hypothetical protein